MPWIKIMSPKKIVRSDEYCKIKSLVRVTKNQGRGRVRNISHHLDA
jgi:hypothetical protein